MKELQGADVIVSGQVTKEVGFGYYTTIRDGEAFVFGVSIPEFDENVPIIADGMMFTEDVMQIFEGMQPGDRISISGYPVIVNDELYIETYDNPYFLGEDE